MRAMRINRVGFPVIVITILCVFAVSAPAQAGPNKGTVGISASVQASQLDILIPIFASPAVVLAPALGFNRSSDAFTDYSIGAIAKFYLRTTKVRPYFSGRFALASLKVEGGTKQTDLIFGPAFGGEYFVDDNFSVAVEAQVNVALTDKGSFRFGNADATIITTASAILATVYF